MSPTSSAAVRPSRAARATGLLVLPVLLAGAAARAAVPSPVALEAMTTVELAHRVAQGTSTVLIPIGGTEQNGAHMVLGKHNLRAQRLAELVARRLGRAVVAPVIAYVPEGDVDAPGGHMGAAGTITAPVPAFEATVEWAARSLCRHGLHDVVLLGDHGGYQASLARVAARVSATGENAGRPACRVHALPQYYRAQTAELAQWLLDQGFTRAEIGEHAGLADTLLALGVDPALVRQEQLDAAPSEGVRGDPRRADRRLGEQAVIRVIDSTVAAIQERLAARRPPAVQRPLRR